MKKHSGIISIVFVFLLLATYVGSYAYMRTYHSWGELYASPPAELQLGYKVISYDQHYPSMGILFYLHYPMKHIDEYITKTHITLQTNDYHGDHSNYRSEQYSSYSGKMY